MLLALYILASRRQNQAFEQMLYQPFADIEQAVMASKYVLNRDVQSLALSIVIHGFGSDVVKSNLLTRTGYSCRHNVPHAQHLRPHPRFSENDSEASSVYDICRDGEGILLTR
ncbi:hypothetical protein AX14_000428 [Amanita brunnescens Koide BX004]|jgi:hypothetical protein|nr:hypothetical protein AX14_000428 [Amanita brunnescens Koide BX004]